MAGGAAGAAAADFFGAFLVFARGAAEGAGLAVCLEARRRRVWTVIAACLTLRLILTRGGAAGEAEAGAGALNSSGWM